MSNTRFNRKSLTDALTSTDSSVRDQIARAAKVGVKVFHVLLVMMLAPVFAFYLLVDLPHLKRVAEGLIPDSIREEVLVVAGRMNQAVGGFFRGQLLVAFSVGVLSSIGLRVIDLQFWLLIGMVAGIFNMIPCPNSLEWLHPSGRGAPRRSAAAAGATRGARGRVSPPGG
jgi:predicted PurR-regulated permease PerM